MISDMGPSDTKMSMEKGVPHFKDLDEEAYLDEVQRGVFFGRLMEEDNVTILLPDTDGVKFITNKSKMDERLRT